MTDHHRSAAGRFFRNPATGDVVVFQPPNAPLWVFLAATAVRLLFQPHGTVGTAVSILGTVSLVVWAGWEVARGDSPFRRAVGVLVLLAVVIGLASRM
jgi:hypothetical protein